MRFFKTRCCHQSGRHWPDLDDTLGFESWSPGAHFGPVLGPWGAQTNPEKNPNTVWGTPCFCNPFGASYSKRRLRFRKINISERAASDMFPRMPSRTPPGRRRAARVTIFPRGRAWQTVGLELGPFGGWLSTTGRSRPRGRQNLGWSARARRRRRRRRRARTSSPRRRRCWRKLRYRSAPASRIVAGGGGRSRFHRHSSLTLPRQKTALRARE